MDTDFGAVPSWLCGAWHRVSLSIFAPLSSPPRTPPILEPSENDDALWILTPNCSATHRYPLSESGAGGAPDGAGHVPSATKTGGRVAFFCDASYSPSTETIKLVHIQDHRGVPRQQLFKARIETRRFKTKMPGAGAIARYNGKEVTEAIEDASREMEVDGLVMVETGSTVKDGREFPYEEVWHRLPLSIPTPFVVLREPSPSSPTPRQILTLGPHCVSIRDPLCKGLPGNAFASRRFVLVGDGGEAQASSDRRKVKWITVDGFGAKWKEVKEGLDLITRGSFSQWNGVVRGEEVMMGFEVWRVEDVGELRE
ncbi:hypothetical protein HDU93_009279 [Gonapodya sp. JEL0774]|nr:hypothetical protein HDU93_009279 [Gonapodya sp. JEL0774]